MRRFFRVLLLTLVLATIFLIAAMTSMRFAIHGREVAIPKVVGLSTADAERALSADGLLLNVESRFYSADIPEGRIMSQIPAPGLKVRRGWKVRAAQSLGPQRVVIPNLIGQSSRAAEMNLKQRGLEMGNVATLHLGNVPPEQIVAQSPPANAVGIASPKVSLLMTAPAEDKPTYFIMPDFVGRKFGDATSSMAEAGFKAGRVIVQKAGVPTRSKPIATDTITRQFPAPGQKVGSGAAIDFDVAR